MQAVQQQSVSAQTPLEELNLPTKLTATGHFSYAEASTEAPLVIEGVTWEINPLNEINNGNATYDPTQGSYAFTPALPQGYALAESTTLPEIWVMVGQAQALASDPSKFIFDIGEGNIIIAPSTPSSTKLKITYGSKIPADYIDNVDPDQVITITGSNNNAEIEVKDKAGTSEKPVKLVFDNLKIERGQHNYETFMVNGIVDITLKEGTKNALKARNGCAGLSIRDNSSVAIGGTGGLELAGGNGGISGGSNSTLVINEGTITSQEVKGNLSLTVNGGTLTCSDISGAGSTNLTEGTLACGNINSSGATTVTGGTLTCNKISGSATSISNALVRCNGNIESSATTISSGKVTCGTITSGAFSTGNKGNAIIFSNGITDTRGKERAQGVFFEGNVGATYGSFTLDQELEIPAGKTLNIQEGSTPVFGNVVAKGYANAFAPLSVLPNSSWQNVDGGWVFEMVANAASSLTSDQYTKYGNTDDFAWSTLVVKGGAFAVDYTYDVVNRAVKILKETPLTVQGKTGVDVAKDRILVAKDIVANLTLSGVTINTDLSALDLNEAGASTITLAPGTKNTMKTGNGPGVNVPDGKKLIITGEGSLEATGSGNNPGIGRGGGSGEVEIQNGVVRANGGNNAAGIGGGSGQSGGIVTITGGQVFATGGYSGAGIGGGKNQSSGTIAITGGQVVAAGGSGGAGIGSGEKGKGGSITISGGTIEARGAGYGESASAGIGGGGKGSVDTINMSGGDIKAFGSQYAAAIGGGDLSESNGNIYISGDAQVYVESESVGIRTGSVGEDERIEISGGSVDVRKSRGLGGGVRKETSSRCSIILSGGTIEGSGVIGQTETQLFDITISNKNNLKLATEHIYGNTTIEGGEVSLSGDISGDRYRKAGDSYLKGIIIIKGGAIKARSIAAEKAHIEGGDIQLTDALDADTWFGGGSLSAVTLLGGILVPEGSEATINGPLTNKGLVCVYGKLTYKGQAWSNVNPGTVCKLKNGVIVGIDDCLTELRVGGMKVIGGNYGDDFTYQKDTLIVKQSVDFTLESVDQNSPTPVGVRICDGVTSTVTLDNVNIEVKSASNGISALALQGTAKVEVVLAAGSKNTLQGNWWGAGLCVSSAATATIGGSGSLNALGGYGGAGIGGFSSNASDSTSSGTIVINSGTIVATAGTGAAGIGPGSWGAGGPITINGGTVTAKGGEGAGGIGRGGGWQSNGSAVVVNGGTIVAKRGNHDGYGFGTVGGGDKKGSVTVNGGIITTDGMGCSFSMGPNSNAFIVSTVPLNDQSGKDSGNWNGVIFEGDKGAVYGNPTVMSNTETPQGKTLTIAPNQTLTIKDGVTFDNRSTITNDGAIVNAGILNNYDHIANNNELNNSGVINNYGTITPNDPIGLGVVNNQANVEVTFVKKGSVDPYERIRYGDTVIITATMSKKTRTAAPMQVDFWLNEVDGWGKKIGTAAANADGANYVARFEVTLSGDTWDLGFSTHGTPIWADFGGIGSVSGTPGLLSSKKQEYLRIERAPLTPVLSVSGVSKVYDGNTRVVGTQPTFTFEGIVGNDQPALWAEFAYDNENAGTDKLITARSLWLLNGDKDYDSLYELSPREVSQVGAVIEPAPQAAPSGLSAVEETIDGRNDGQITGTSSEMEYDTTPNFTAPVTCVDGGVVGLAPSTYYVRYKQKPNYNAGEAVEVMVAQGAPRTYTLNATAPTFDSVKYGYTQPAAKGIALANVGNSSATITNVSVPADAPFTVAGAGNSVASGQTIDTWTIQPKTGLSVGVHTATITVAYQDGSDVSATATATAEVSFTVNQATLSPAALPNAAPITYGQTLSNSALTGGSALDEAGALVDGNYVWGEGSLVPSVANSDTTPYSITFKPTDSRNYQEVTAAVTLTVHEATLTPVLSVSGVTKVYDGNISIVGAQQPVVSLTGALSGETPTCSASFAYDSANAGDSKTINAADISLTADAVNNNYVLSVTSASATGAAITNAPQSAPSGLSAVAETIDGRHDGQITGTTTEMEYDTDANFTTPVSCADGGVVGLAPNTYFVRYKEKPNYNAGEAVEVLVAQGAPRTYTLNATAPTFDSVKYGYTQPAAKGIALANVGNSSAAITNVSVPTDAPFTVAGAGNSVASGSTIDTWTIQPKTGLGVGTHTATITVAYKDGSDANATATETVEVSFTVSRATPIIDATLTPSAITYGQSLSESILAYGEAGVEGTFAWADGTIKPSVADSEATEYEVVFTPTDLTNYTIATVQVKLKVNPYTPLVAKPLAGGIAYGETLSRSALESGSATGVGNQAIAGTFTWADSVIKPSVADSEATEYEVVFTPADSTNYTTATTQVKLKVDRAMLTPVLSVSDVTKPYDGGVEVKSDLETLFSFIGIVGADEPSVHAVLSYDNASVGNNKTINATNIALTADAVSNNYVLSATSASATGAAITNAPQVAPSGLSAVAETIDGRHDGQITGTTTEMEYDTDANFTTPVTCVDGGVVGLAPNTYFVRYKQKPNYNAGEAVEVMVAQGAPRTYTLNATAPAFDSVKYGYTQPAAKGIVLANTGNSSAIITNVSVPTDAPFTVAGAGNSVASGSTIDTWTIQPKTGLGSGTHTATITVAYQDGSDANATATATTTVSFTVNRTEVSVPSIPTQAQEFPATHNTITISAVPDQRYMCTTSPTAPAISDEGWVSAATSTLTFTSLLRNTTYYVWAFKPETANTEASAVSEALFVSTTKEPIDTLNVLGITPPVAKGAPDATAESAPGWTSGVVSWFVNSAPFAGSLFDYSTAYRAKVTLTASAGYEFSADAVAQVAGATAAIESQNADTLTLGFTYTATAAQGQTQAPVLENATFQMKQAVATSASFTLVGDEMSMYKLYDQQAGTEAASGASVRQEGSTLVLSFAQAPAQDVTFYLSATNTKDDLLESPRVPLFVKAYVPTSSLTLNRSNLVLEVGATDNLIAVLMPSNATNKEVVWSTSNQSVARVSTEGVVSALSTGSATIEACTSDGQTATCEVAVLPAPSQQSVQDASTGVTLTGVFSSDAQIKVVKDAGLHEQGFCGACDIIRTRQNNNSLIALFDIGLSAGRHVGSVNVEIPVGQAYNNKQVIILHCKNGELETQSLKVENAVAGGLFTSFSPFAVALEPDQGGNAEQGAPTNTADVSENAKKNNGPKPFARTNDSLLIWPWLLVIGVSLGTTVLLAQRSRKQL